MSLNSSKTDFSDSSKGLNSPASIGALVTAGTTWGSSDSPRSFLCTADGTLVMKDSEGTTINNIPSITGLILPFEGWTELTSGPDLIALW